MENLAVNLACAFGCLKVLILLSSPDDIAVALTAVY